MRAKVSHSRECVSNHCMCVCVCHLGSLLMVNPGPLSRLLAVLLMMPCLSMSPNGTASPSVKTECPKTAHSVTVCQSLWLWLCLVCVHTAANGQSVCPRRPLVIEGLSMCPSVHCRVSEFTLCVRLSLPASALCQTPCYSGVQSWYLCA